MVKDGLIGDEDTPEVQVVVVEEVVHHVQVEFNLGRGDLGPFDLEVFRQAVVGLDLAEPIRDLAALLCGAPHRAKDHDPKAVVL